MLGCSGSHKVGDAWGPCESEKDVNKLIELGNPKFREWKKRQSKKTSQNLPKGSFVSEDLASKEAVKIGCSGAHMSKQGVWFPCGTPEEYNAARAHAGVGGSRILRASRPTRRVVSDRKHWEKLRGRGVSGIESMPGGGLVSAKSSDSFPDSFKPLSEFTAYPTQEMTASAKLGVKLREKHNVGTSVKSLLLGKKIARGDELSDHDVIEMKEFFDLANNQISYKSGVLGLASKIAWLVYGGNSGYEFSRNVSLLLKSDIHRKKYENK